MEEEDLAQISVILLSTGYMGKSETLAVASRGRIIVRQQLMGSETETEISTVIRCIAMKFGTDIHGPQRMNAKGLSYVITLEIP